MVFFKNLFVKPSLANSLSSLAFLQSPISTLLVDIKGTILQANQAIEKLTGYRETDLIGETMSIFKSGQYNNAFYKSFWQKLLDSQECDFEMYNRCKDNTVILMHEKIRSITSKGEKYFVITLEDITEQKKLTERYRHLATHDPLTGLANRTLLKDRFSHACLSATRNGKKVGLIICDLNEFKQCNDNYGHNFGDNVLQKVSSKLQQLVRVSDTVSRYGGDEFIIVLEHIENTNEVIGILRGLKSSFPLPMEAEEYDIGISVGHASFPDEGTTFEQLVALADMKMYKEKEKYYGH